MTMKAKKTLVTKMTHITQKLSRKKTTILVMKKISITKLIRP